MTYYQQSIYILPCKDSECTACVAKLLPWREVVRLYFNAPAQECSATHDRTLDAVTTSDYFGVGQGLVIETKTEGERYMFSCFVQSLNICSIWNLAFNNFIQAFQWVFLSSIFYALSMLSYQHTRYRLSHQKTTSETARLFQVLKIQVSVHFCSCTQVRTGKKR